MSESAEIRPAEMHYLARMENLVMNLFRSGMTRRGCRSDSSSSAGRGQRRRCSTLRLRCRRPARRATRSRRCSTICSRKSDVHEPSARDLQLCSF
uniref:Uncharacterized protein n=1 Tax=Arundo donax TaxID=35708 RepID=A0A0A9CPE2_ARUDO